MKKENLDIVAAEKSFDELRGEIQRSAPGPRITLYVLYSNTV